MESNLLIYQGRNKPLPAGEAPRILELSPLDKSSYIETRRVVFEDRGRVRNWDLAKSHDSVAVVIYHREKRGFIFVRQLRISVFLKNSEHGYVYELCAGLCDKGVNPRQTALEELQEECGYFIEAERLERLAEFYSSVGLSGTRQNLFYAEVDSKDKKALGGGKTSEGENIELIFVPEALADEFMQDEACPKTPSLCYGILWQRERQRAKGGLHGS